MRIYFELTREIVIIEVATRVRAVDAMVNAVDHDEELLVISAGKEQSIQPGYEFVITRDGNVVGHARVIRVYPELAGCRIVWHEQGRELQRGDRASLVVSLVRVLAELSHVPVIMDARLATAEEERLSAYVDSSLTAEKVLSILRSEGWLIIEQAVPRRAYVVLTAPTIAVDG